MKDTLERLEAWYATQCDGDWEHQYGIKLDTLDNPGWRLRVDLLGTGLAGTKLMPVEVERDKHDWYRCWIKDDVYEAACGPRNLHEVIRAFLELER